MVFNLFITFKNVKVHKHCLYWKVFSTNIYRKIYFNSLVVFNYICWSVNCMSWVSKLNNFFLTYTETEARFIFEGFDIALSVTLSVSKLYELSLWIIEHILEMSSNVNINLYFRPCSNAIYEKFFLYCLYNFKIFWSGSYA